MTNNTAPPAGTLSLVGRLVQASNATFLAEDEEGTRFLYKPIDGEAPLRDFPDRTLARREVAAWLLSEAAGFALVPPTHWVADGPFGQGSAQLWIEGSQTDLVDLVAAEEVPEDWFGIVVGVDEDERPVALVHADEPALRRLALFDIIANNADRKGAHIIHSIEAGEEHVHGVDHGLTFHAQDKLRTVLWGWSGQTLTEDELELVHHAAESVEVLERWLDETEIIATRLRAERLLAAGEFPSPGDRWPVIPWPPL